MATGPLSIKLRCASWPQLATIYKRDLTRGAMFLKASTPPAVGTQVRIDLTLPSGSVIVLTGTVEKQVTDPQRGAGVELKLAPIPAGTIWMIESALAAEAKQQQRAQAAAPDKPAPSHQSGPVAAIGAGEDVATAEADLIRALVAEAESLKKLNPFLVLGIGYESNDNDVRAAFGALTKRYHPDRFTRYQSMELRNVAAEIFILIRDAYRRVCSADARAKELAQIGRSTAPRPVPMRATPPGGVPRMSQSIPAVPPLPRGMDKTTPIPVMTTSGPTTRLQDQVTKKPEPLPPRDAGNDDVTKKPVPLEKRPGGTTPPHSQPIVRAGSPPPAEPAEHEALDELLEQGRIDEALAGYRLHSKRHPNDRVLRAGIELCEGLLALAQRDRMEAAQRFEAALEIDPSNERAARELAEMRRQATNERKGLLSRLMGKKE
jgi:hypothetical protein